jgi:hypothetical protein
MGKGNKNRKNRDDASANSGNKKKESSTDVATTAPPGGSATTFASSSTRGQQQQRRSLYRWCLRERQGVVWVVGCTLCGAVFGFGIGSGWLVGEWGHPPNPWRISLGGQIRDSQTYAFLMAPAARVAEGNFFLGDTLASVLGGLGMSTASSSSSSSSGPSSRRRRGGESVAVREIDPDVIARNPSHPFLYAVLREAVVRESGGYLHPDLGILEPAPCGAARGLGMVRNAYHNCQVRCIPGLAHEKLEAKVERKTLECSGDDDLDCNANNRRGSHPKYMQEEVLIRVPLSFQMTRKVALDTLLPLVSAEVQRKASIHELDDAALLTLLLAHERGVGPYSRWYPYIASLPHEPSCGYSQKLRPYILDSINALRDELGMDVNGWPGELLKATQYAQKIAASLTKDYGPFLLHPEGVSALGNIEWALCHVASRATGGSQKHGALRMIPVIDMLNHDFDAGGMVELTGQERLEEGDFVDALAEEDEGAFVVRSIRHGRRKALRVGQELVVNYNVPHYSALDWLVSSGFVPPERFRDWQKLDAPLPRIRRDGPFAGLHDAGSGGGRHMFHGGNPSEAVGNG